MKAFLDHFGAILGALTVALLTMSASHEYGYFLVVGQHFQTLLTTTDLHCERRTLASGSSAVRLGSRVAQIRLSEV